MDCRAQVPKWVWVFIGVLGVWSAVAWCQTTAPATTSTSPITPGPLEIHVIAIQGGGQYRPDGEPKWQAVKAGLDLTEGVEFRTGPKGTIQFTVGTDQVYRVDRLTVVKVLRASLQPDGTIKTDVGMTYGRVSKDVDEPERPHDDMIIAPSSTLAVRGTRVSLYDQPPFAPEAVSLTGAADFTNIHGLLVHFGAKGQGKTLVNGNSTDAANTQLRTSDINPLGENSGLTPAQEEFAHNFLGGTSVLSSGIFSQLVVSKSPTDTVFGALPVPGELFFALNWTGTPFTQIDYSVTSPLGEVVSHDELTAPSGGKYQSDVSNFTANSTGTGKQQITWAVLGETTGFPTGGYTISETLLGTTSASLAADPSITAATV
ncbi:MAG TPA: hypothetical protein VL992_20345, partial [Tepidisphaeraceae bacterium]|nr:hypothetical protein [Tepidisphaeraceae bacterium]